MESGLSERLQKRAKAKAELSYGQALWYAWGRLDGGGYGPIARRKIDAMEFASEVQTARWDFETGKTRHMLSIQDMWTKYVERVCD